MNRFENTSGVWFRRPRARWPRILAALAGILAALAVIGFALTVATCHAQMRKPVAPEFENTTHDFIEFAPSPQGQK